MNAFATQTIRKKHGVNWNEEYIIAMVANNEGISTTDVLKASSMYKLMSPATAHKYLMQVVKKKLLVQKQDKEDRRGVGLFTSAKGKHFLEEIKDAYR